jgi:hypothetical protein
LNREGGGHFQLRNVSKRIATMIADEFPNVVLTAEESELLTQVRAELAAANEKLATAQKAAQDARNDLALARQNIAELKKDLAGSMKLLAGVKKQTPKPEALKTSLAKKLALWGIIGTTAAVGTVVAFYYLFALATKNPQSANLENRRQEGRKSDKPSDEEESKKEEDTKNRNKPREEFTFKCILDKVSTGNSSDILECDENAYKMYLIVGGTILAALLIFCFLCRYFCLRKRTASGAITD